MLEAYEGTGSYTKEQRHLLVSHLEDPEQRKHPWPAKLDVAFGIQDPEEVAAKEAAAKAAAGDGDGAQREAVPGREAGGVVATGDGAEAATATSSAKGGGGGGDGAGRGDGGRGNAGRGGAGGGRSGGKARERRRFAGKGTAAVAATGGGVLLGSPMLDATLEDTQGLREVIETLKQETGLSDSTGGLQMEVCNARGTEYTSVCLRWHKVLGVL